MNRYISMLLLLLALQTSLRSQNSDWVQANPNPQNDFYAIKFFNQTTGYVIGSGGVILKNTTGSNSWTTIPSGTVNDLYGMYFFDVNHGYIVGAGGLILYTSDGGGNWTHLVTSNGYALRSITFVNQNTGFIVGDHGELYRTTTGLFGWTLTNVTTKNLHSVFFSDSVHGYACGDSGTFLRTTNGGNNWSVQIVGTANLNCISFNSLLTGYMSSSSEYTNSPVYLTNDGGLTWTIAYLSSMNYNFYAVNFNSQGKGFICGKNSPVMVTTNGGTNWNMTGLPMPTVMNSISMADTVAFICGTNGFVAIASSFGIYKYIGGSRGNFSQMSFINENTGFISSGFQYLRTTNGGLNWDISAFGWLSWYEGCADYITWLGSFPSGNSYRVVEEFNCHGWYSFYNITNSTDGGATWNGSRAFWDQNIGINGICEVDGTTFVIAATPGLTIYKNYGTGWLPIGSGNVSGITFANQNTGVVLIPGPAPGIMRTTDGGSNWVTTPTGFTRGIRDIKLFPSGMGYLCGDSSLFERTTDFGASWTMLSNNTNATLTQIQFAGDNTGWVMGYTLGNNSNNRIFYTPNGGTNLMQLQSLMNFSPKGMSLINANTGYVCGDSGIVLKTTNGGITFVNPELENLPKEFSLTQNYPNPFNPSTTIKFDIPVKRETSNVKLIIYDVLGRVVTILINQQLQPGSYSVDWDASIYPSGVYFYQLSIGNEQLASKRMVLIK